MPALFAVLAILLDLLVQMFAVLATGAVIAGVVRGVSAEDGAGLLLCLAVAIGGHWILVRRIRAGRRTIATARAGSEEVGTRTPGHFVSDGLCILALSAMLVAMRDPPWGAAERAGTISMLVACLALGVLRATLVRLDPD
ncbi:hypothetical protein SAMN02745121_02335 [Nannocystis exedens]|uniref:Uncharacterized protein n=1 Tax=Nannocystis exedens TaxID=54 RepID=A0A1I1WGB1_9BACT|nr:hypothetical protein [Nannocystis exedens]PCC67698.1 hypothetical protein NAEX_00706 [Nannocystis exedens]SFD94206.1 hypothetical protein SAMN02745121_02335 [Nannocystis exedens]